MRRRRATQAELEEGQMIREAHARMHREAAEIPIQDMEEEQIDQPQRLEDVAKDGESGNGKSQRHEVQRAPGNLGSTAKGRPERTRSGRLPKET